jgi:hypothetical protein
MEKGFDRVVNEAKSSPKTDRSQPLSMQHLLRLQLILMAYQLRE